VDSDQLPTDRLQMAALVALAVADIEFREEIDIDLLLASFMRTAWPTNRCEQQ
jgi:hypothetical protein